MNQEDLKVRKLRHNRQADMQEVKCNFEGEKS